LLWDEELLGDYPANWLRWLEDLKNLDQFNTHRLFNLLNFGVVPRCQTRYFADAPEMIMT